MANTAPKPQSGQIIPLSGAVTAHHDFCRVSFEGETLFSVREGVPLHDAFDQLTALLTAAQGAVEMLASTSSDTEVPDSHWAAVHVLSFANALVQGMHAGHNAHVRCEA